MKLNISCATKTYPIEIQVEQTPNNVVDHQTTSAEKGRTVNTSTTDAQKISTLGSLKQQVCSLCNISLSVLKIVHRENDKLLVLGKPPTTETDVGWKLLVDFDRKHTVNISKTYATNENDLTQLEKNFLKDPERRGYIKGMDKRLKTYAENCMKLLETLDGLQINNDNTEEEQAQRNREKRKFLVDGLQDALNKNDKLMARLSDYLNRCEHPEDAL